ncbi:MAG TPA: glycosyltransferase family A protein [Thermodesulfobacteriota bacterium]|nr:glycosyltransferase family A protein [Thermodesulfobacteriota bacterium]
MSEEPLVSCLCVTLGRPRLLERAIRCFRGQAYPRKELVVIYESFDQPTKDVLDGIDDPDIVRIEAPDDPGVTLGSLRNMAVSKCSGEYFCQWDDDDYSHPGRIAFQMGVIEQSGLPACILMQWFIFDEAGGRAYLSNRRPWEGGLLCKTSLIEEGIEYDDLKVGEDTPLVRKLFSKGLVFPVIMPRLYIYTYHGGNTWSRTHWEKIFASSKPLSDESSRLIRGILDGTYDTAQAAEILDGISD